jgi:hypothetical protein
MGRGCRDGKSFFGCKLWQQESLVLVDRIECQNSVRPGRVTSNDNRFVFGLPVYDHRVQYATSKNDNVFHVVSRLDWFHLKDRAIAGYLTIVHLHLKTLHYFLHEAAFVDYHTQTAIRRRLRRSVGENIIVSNGHKARLFRRAFSMWFPVDDDEIDPRLVSDLMSGKLPTALLSPVFFG